VVTAGRTALFPGAVVTVGRRGPDGGDGDGGGGGGVVLTAEEERDGVVPVCGGEDRRGLDGVEEGVRKFGSLTVSKLKSSS
jgi:hypothetical protein